MLKYHGYLYVKTLSHQLGQTSMVQASKPTQVEPDQVQKVLVSFPATLSLWKQANLLLSYVDSCRVCKCVRDKSLLKSVNL